MTILAPQDDRPYIGYERRRQMQVRGSLGAALKSNADVKFLLACAEYLLVSMSRLDAQDMAILVRLRDRVPQSETEVHDGLTALDERQAKARDGTARFGQSVAAFKDGRIDGAAFALHVRAFNDLIQGMMQPRRNPYEHYTDRLFSDEDWTAIADATPTARAEELRLFKAVRELAPAGAEPDAMASMHGRPSGNHVAGN